jgi:sortase A
MNSESATSGEKQSRFRLSPFFLFSGIAVLGYAGFQYGAMFFEQRHLQALWREQQGIPRATVRNSGQSSQVERSESGLTRITIPSIEFSAVIVEGTDGLSLMIGPGHMTGTALPGEPGNAVISAHRETFFRNIVQLSAGDHILIERDGQTFTYVVEGFRIVKPTDLSVAAPTNDSRLTLVTCDPAHYPGMAPQRLVVVSKLLAPTPAAPELASATGLLTRVATAKQPRPHLQPKQARAAAQR